MHRLRTLYEEGEPNAIAILLGSSSLDDAVARLNELEQSARQSENAVTDTQRGRAQLSELATILASAMASGRVAGVEVTIYNPALDPAGTAGAALTDAVARGLGAVTPSTSTGAA